MLTARYRGCVGDARRRYRGDRPGHHGLLRQLGHGSWRIQRGRPVECSQRTLHSPYRRRRIRSDSTHQHPSFRRLPAAIADLCSRTQQLSASSDRQECPVSQHGPGLGRPWGLLITPFPLSTAADQVGTLLPSALHFPALLTLDSGSASDAGGICQHPPGRPVPAADVLEMDSAARVPSSRCPRRPGDGADALRVLRNETSGLHSPPSPWRHTVLSAASLPTINVDLCGSPGTRGGG